MRRQRGGLGRRARALALSSALVALGCEPAPWGDPLAEAEPAPVTRLIGTLGVRTGQFALPRAIAAGPELIWVIDKSGRIQGIDPDSGLTVVSHQLTEIDNGKPVGLTAIARPGGGERLYIADTHMHRVLVMDADDWPAPGRGTDQIDVVPAGLARAATFGEYGHELGQFVFPTDVAIRFDEAGAIDRIFVGEYGGGDRVTVFNADYEAQFAFGFYGIANEHEGPAMCRPQGVEFDAQRDEVLIADSRNHRIGRFTPAGELVAWIDGAGLRYPYGVAPVGDGSALVVEYGGNRIQHIDLETGAGLGVIGRAGRGPGEIATPWGVAVVGRLAYVLDSGNNRILVTPTPGGGS